jgi:hypothetical protein
MLSEPTMTPEQVPSLPMPHSNRKAWILGISIGTTVLCLIAAFVFSVFGLLAHSAAAKLALSTAESNPTLVAQLGTPVQTGRFVTGSVEVQNSTGRADLAIPLAGPKGTGTLYTQAHETAGVWRLDLLEFHKDGSSVPINLLPAAPDF